MKVNHLLRFSVILFGVLYNFQIIESKPIRIIDIEPTENSKVIIVKGINIKGEKFKIISLVENKKCDYSIQEGEVYPLVLHSAFSSITHGHTMTGYGIGDLMITTEPEEGYNHLYVTNNLDGICYVK